MTTIAKNVSGSEKRFLGVVLANGSQQTISDNYSPYEIATDDPLQTYIASGDIVINDGTSDLSIAEAQGLLSGGNPSIVSQAEAEAGTQTIARYWTAQRVKQAIDALAGGAVSSVFGRVGAVIAQAGDYTADQITETVTRIFFTPTEKTKLSGIEAGAEVNPDLVPQAEAEAGVSNTERVWSALRNKQAFDAYPKEKTRIYKRMCGNSGTQNIDNDEVVVFDGGTEDINDTAIVTFSGNVFTLKKTGGIYKIHYVLEGEMQFNLFGGTGAAKAELERNNNGAGWNDVNESWSVEGDIPRSANQNAEFNLIGFYEITDSVADQTQLRLTAEDYSNPNWDLYKDYSKIVIEWTGDE